MGKPGSALDIHRLLERSNCGECGEKTCLGFAAAVYRRERGACECPRLGAESAERLAAWFGAGGTDDQEMEKELRNLRSKVAELDLADVAREKGGTFSENRLTLKVMGKSFSVDTHGNLSADIHINPWVAIPFLRYVTNGVGRPLTGNWVSFRELKGGRERYPLFRKRCEEPMKRVADAFASLFDDMVHVLGGRRVEERFEADISVVLAPLPKVPVMICYRLPEDGMESSLNVYFDESADENLDIGSIFTLGAGLALMFTKIGWTHAFS